MKDKELEEAQNVTKEELQEMFKDAEPVEVLPYPPQARETVARIWAEMDGYLHGYETDDGGAKAGYASEADYLLRRMVKAGFVVLPRDVWERKCDQADARSGRNRK
jgi:hypothetical protein